ncbi:MAG: glycosyltransferase family 4 protein [Candidatus Hydrogenedentales bacterium]
MNILQVNKFLWEHAGPERYMFEVSQLLESNGHTVEYFAMQHERNRASANASYFVKHIEYRDTSVAYKLRTFRETVEKTVYSPEARRKMDALLESHHYDIAHLHMISHQISPSILSALKRRRVPVVQTLHEYKLICPASHLYIKHRGEICERCVSGAYINALRYRCLKDSAAASGLASVAQYIHRWTRIHERNIDLFLCPSGFLAQKHIEGGVPEAKIRVLQNYLDLQGYEPKYEPGEYAVFIGRLSEEKGIETLIKAAAALPQLPLLIVGEGEQRPVLEELVQRQNLRHITFAGYQSGDELKATIQNAAFLVLPSEWYENCPMVTYEAYALGKPVVASDIGGVGESIDYGATGLLFKPGDIAGLRRAMTELWGGRARCESMGRAGRIKVERICGRHYDLLLGLYEEARSLSAASAA